MNLCTHVSTPTTANSGTTVNDRFSELVKSANLADVARRIRAALTVAEIDFTDDPDGFWSAA